MRRVFDFQTWHHPLEPSGLGCLPRDLAHLVLVHLPLSTLCGLKRVSRSVVNACRRALCSSELYDEENDDTLDVMIKILSQCDLSFPIRVVVSKTTTDPDCRITEDLPIYVVHELACQFFLKGKPVDLETAAEWIFTTWATLPDVDELSVFDNIRVVCTRFCIETPSAIFFDEMEFTRTIKFTDENSLLTHDVGHLRLLSAIACMFPYASLGGTLLSLESGLGHDPECGLVYWLLRGRLVSR